MYPFMLHSGLQTALIEFRSIFDTIHHSLSYRTVKTLDYLEVKHQEADGPEHRVVNGYSRRSRKSREDHLIRASPTKILRNNRACGNSC